MKFDKKNGLHFKIKFMYDFNQLNLNDRGNYNKR